MQLFENIWDSISSAASQYLPDTLMAIVILVLGWLFAKFLKRLTTKLLKKTEVDEKLGGDRINLSRFLSKLVFFLAMIFVFMLALEKLGMNDVMEPMKGMLGKFLGFIPNIVGAGLVAYIGYMLANIVSELVGLSGDTIQKLVPKLKMPENIDLVQILKKVVFIIIFIPLLIAALNILNMNAISEPATEMLQTFMNAIPKVMVAAIILIFFIVGGRFIVTLLEDLFTSMNLNHFLKKINLDSITGDNDLVKLIGNIVYAFIIVFGLVTAVEKLEFRTLSEILETVVHYGGRILFGLVILVIGNWIANIVKNNFAGKKGNAFVSSIIQVAIMAVFLAIGLKAMGIADEIINLAFGISLGTVAVTIALSFGLGGREAAGKQMGRIIDRFNNKN